MGRSRGLVFPGRPHKQKVVIDAQREVECEPVLAPIAHEQRSKQPGRTGGRIEEIGGTRLTQREGSQALARPNPTMIPHDRTGSGGKPAITVLL